MRIYKYFGERDKNKIEKLLQNHDYLSNFVRNEKKFPESIYVSYDGNELLGFISFDGIKRIANIVLYVSPLYRRQCIGTKLLEYAENVIKEYEKIEHSRFKMINDNNIVAKCFLESNSFIVQVSCYTMERTGEYLPDYDMSVRKYEYDDYYEWHRIEEVAFYLMRERIGVEPSYYYPPYDEEKEDYFKNKDNMFVFLVDDKIIGIGRINKNELYVVAVSHKMQEKGYGKKIVSYLVNTIIEQGYNNVVLRVAKDNFVKKLYESLGFVTIKYNHNYIKYYRPDTRMKSPPSYMLNV